MADFRGAGLSGAKLTCADLRGVVFDGTILDDVDLEGALIHAPSEHGDVTCSSQVPDWLEEAKWEIRELQSGDNAACAIHRREPMDPGQA